MEIPCYVEAKGIQIDPEDTNRLVIQSKLGALAQFHINATNLDGF